MGDESTAMPEGAANAAPAKAPELSKARCIECGYALKGLSTSGVCPECGIAIRESVVGWLADWPLPELQHILRHSRWMLTLAALHGLAWTWLTAATRSSISTPIWARDWRDVPAYAAAFVILSCWEVWLVFKSWSFARGLSRVSSMKATKHAAARAQWASVLFGITLVAMQGEWVLGLWSALGEWVAILTTILAAMWIPVWTHTQADLLGKAAHQLHDRRLAGWVALCRVAAWVAWIALCALLGITMLRAGASSIPQPGGAALLLGDGLLAFVAGWGSLIAMGKAFGLTHRLVREAFEQTPVSAAADIRRAEEREQA